MIQSINVLDAKVVDKGLSQVNHRKNIIEQYFDFCDKQMSSRTLWYLIPLISLPAGVMPLGMYFMSFFEGFTTYAGFSILLFFCECNFKYRRTVHQSHDHYIHSNHLIQLSCAIS